MEMKELKDRILGALSAITGEDPSYISSENQNQVLNVFASKQANGTFKVTTPDEVIIKTLDRAPMEYYGSTKVPQPTFWKRVKQDVQSSWRAKNKEKPWDNYTKTAELSESEKEKMNTIFRDFEKKYSVQKEKDKTKPFYFTKKIERYKQYIQDDLVRIDDEGSSLYNQWIKRDSALQQCLSFHDPKMWLNEVSQRKNVSRGTFFDNGMQSLSAAIEKRG